jgi:Virulence factor BrkB
VETAPGHVPCHGCPGRSRGRGHTGPDRVGPLTQSLGSALGLGPAAVLAWRIAKWPILLIVVLVIVATLNYATPNVKQTKFRWLSIGALVAIIIWALVSVAFGFSVANFSSYNKTYGALAGVIVFLLWLWITPTSPYSSALSSMPSSNAAASSSPG